MNPYEVADVMTYFFIESSSRCSAFENFIGKNYQERMFP